LRGNPSKRKPEGMSSEKNAKLKERLTDLPWLMASWMLGKFLGIKSICQSVSAMSFTFFQMYSMY